MFNTLAKWLTHLEQQGGESAMKLGLERVAAVAKQCQLLPLPSKTVVVAGTNGKGTTTAVLEQLLINKGLTVGCFTSPHLLTFNERIRINGDNVDDELIVDAFNFISKHADNIGLSYFEWVALAALVILKQAKLDVIILEVGLGGRLDAVNIVDADISIITSIDYEHMAFLGNTLEKIGVEKAGVFREKQAIICTEPKPPLSISESAKRMGAPYLNIGRDFFANITDETLDFELGQWQLTGLPTQALHPNNIAGALSAYHQLMGQESREFVIESLNNVKLIGRAQLFSYAYPIILDVAHNRQAINHLASVLSKLPERCQMVFSMLNDKPISQAISALSPYVKQWHCAPLLSPRSSSKPQLQSEFEKQQVTYHLYDTIEQAMVQAEQAREEQQTLVIAGSFLTVAEGLQYLSRV